MNPVARNIVVTCFFSAVVIVSAADRAPYVALGRDAHAASEECTKACIAKSIKECSFKCLEARCDRPDDSPRPCSPRAPCDGSSRCLNGVCRGTCAKDGDCKGGVCVGGSCVPRSAADQARCESAYKACLEHIEKCEAEGEACSAKCG